MSEVGWIDFSPKHRQRVGAVLDLLKAEGVVDELGIGTVRDGLADQLFPGISTIQTRAKYFFIVPYILYDYQKLKRSQLRGKSVSKYIEEQEYEIMWELGDKYDHNIGSGVIGITKRRPEKIMRRPSAIYWNGIVIYRFVNTGGLSLETFLNQRSSKGESLLSMLEQGDDVAKDDIDAEHEDTFRLRVGYDPDWRRDLKLDMTLNEADFFKHRIREVAGDKLIGELSSNDELYELFVNNDNFMNFAKRAIRRSFDKNIKKELILAHDFSEMIYGAHIAYNCLLQKAKYNKAYFNDDWRQWAEQLETRMINYEGFRPDDLFIHAPTTRSGTQGFIVEWWNYLRRDRSAGKRRDELVQTQEWNIKKRKSRLRLARYEDVKEGKWIGLQYLDYRYRNAKGILNDIKNVGKK